MQPEKAVQHQWLQPHHQFQHQPSTQPGSMSFNDANLHALPKIDEADAAKFIGGFLQGIIKADHFSDIGKCLKNGETVAAEL